MRAADGGFNKVLGSRSRNCRRNDRDFFIKLSGDEESGTLDQGCQRSGDQYNEELLTQRMSRCLQFTVVGDFSRQVGDDVTYLSPNDAEEGTERNSPQDGGLLPLRRNPTQNLNTTPVQLEGHDISTLAVQAGTGEERSSHIGSEAPQVRVAEVLDRSPD